MCVMGLITRFRQTYAKSARFYHISSYLQIEANNMSEFALKNGEPLPPVDRNLMRIYSMRFCPFAQRTRIVLLHKNIPHETVNVNLRYKPDWFLARNPLGLVPVLEHHDDVIYESSVCDEYLDRLYPDDGQGRLTPDCPKEKARHDMLMRLFDAKVPPSIYGLLKPDRAEKARATLAFGLKVLEDNLGDMKFFGGDKPCMIDYHVFPWFERFPANHELSKMTGTEYNPLPASEYPRLVQWFDRMQKIPAVRDTMFSIDYHMQFQMSFAQKNIKYDIGLDRAEARL